MIKGFCSSIFIFSMMFLRVEQYRYDLVFRIPGGMYTPITKTGRLLSDSFPLVVTISHPFFLDVY